VSQDIIILPGSATFEFYDSGSTLSTWVYSSGSLEYKVGATIYFSILKDANAGATRMVVSNTGL
jgi:hypothetical protein